MNAVHVDVQSTRDDLLFTLQQKYFDSGDYNMAKAKMNNPKKPLPAQEKLILQETLGDAIPTPETLATRKPSLIQSKLVDGSLIWALYIVYIISTMFLSSVGEILCYGEIVGVWAVDAPHVLAYSQLCWLLWN